VLCCCFNYVMCVTAQVVDVTYGLFVWPCAPLLAKFVFYNRDIIVHKHVLEVGAKIIDRFQT